MHKSLNRVLKLVVSLVILYFLFSQFNVRIPEIVQNVLGWKYFFGAVFSSAFLVQVICTNRWKLFLSESGIQESMWTLWRINWISLFVGLIIPSSQGQDVIRMFYIEKRHPERHGKPGSTVLIERMIGLGVLSLLSLIAYPFLDNPPTLASFLIIGVCLSGFCVIGLVVHPWFFHLYSERRIGIKAVDKAIAFIQSMHGAIIAFPFRRVLFLSIILIGCFQFLMVLSVDLIFRAYGIDIPYINHLALYPVIATLSLAPITIGGFGVREGFFVYFYGTLGVPPEVAISVSVMNYAVLILVPAVFGGMLFLIESLGRGQLSNPAHNNEGVADERKA